MPERSSPSNSGDKRSYKLPVVENRALLRCQDKINYFRRLENNHEVTPKLDLES